MLRIQTLVTSINRVCQEIRNIKRGRTFSNSNKTYSHSNKTIVSINNIKGAVKSAPPLEYNNLEQEDSNENHDLHDIYSSYKTEPPQEYFQIYSSHTSLQNGPERCPIASSHLSYHESQLEHPPPVTSSETWLTLPPCSNTSDPSSPDPGGGIGMAMEFSSLLVVSSSDREYSSKKACTSGEVGDEENGLICSDEQRGELGNE